MRDHSDQIIIEVGAHDHIASLRYHSSDNVLNFKDTATHYDFHNLLVAPAVTMNKGNNPGIAMFEVDGSGTPGQLKYEFLDLQKTYGSTTIPTDLTFYPLDFDAMYDVSEITPLALADWRKRLEADNNMTLDYLVRKVGFNPTIPSEYSTAMAIYASEGLVTSKDDYACFLCQMHKSISSTEENACCSGNGLSSAMLAREEAEHLMFL